MISNNNLKRKLLSASSSSSATDNHNTITMTTSKRFRSTACNGKIEQSKKEIINNSKQQMTTEYHQLQYELQCQEALLILMQKLKTNQRTLSQTKQTPVNSTKPNSTIKSSHPNQYTINRSNNNSQQQSTKISIPLSQTPTHQSNNSTTATRLSSIVPTKNSSSPSSSTSTINNSLKNNGIPTDQHLLNAKLALRKQLEQTLLQIPTPKPSTCDLTYIPGINGWSEFLTLIGLEQAFNTYTDVFNRRYSSEISFSLPYMCTQCGTDWSTTWHEIINIDQKDNEKILCDRCRKTSQKKILKQDHSNRLRQAFMKALQQEKELDAKFQQQSTTIKQSSSSHNKHSSKTLSTKLNSNKHQHPHHHHHHQQQHRHSGKINSVKHTIPTDTFTSPLTNLPTNEQIELFQKHLSNMLQFSIANPIAKTIQQQQQQVLAASIPVMAASLMCQGNPAQYLLEMIPQAAKQQQQHHHRHSK